MKALFDLFPIVLFFIAYKTYDIYTATAVAIIASFVQIVLFWFKHKRFEKMHVITFAMIFFMGGLTIFLKDPKFLMWKVSAINVVFALIFFGSFFVGKKNIAERMFGAALEATSDDQPSLPQKAWNTINWLWVLVFLLIAAINTYFVLPALTARNNFLGNYDLKESETIKKLACDTTGFQDLCLLAQQTESSWVNFKLFGSMGITVAASVISVIFLMSYLKKAEGGNTVSKVNEHDEKGL